MNTFEIVALNPENQGFNILEAGYDSYEHALTNREHWAMRFPHLWIEVITRNERIAMVSAEGLRKLNLVGLHLHCKHHSFLIMDTPKVKLKVKTSITLKLNKKQAQALRNLLNDCDLECYNQSDYLYELRNQLSFLDSGLFMMYNAISGGIQNLWKSSEIALYSEFVNNIVFGNLQLFSILREFDTQFVKCGMRYIISSQLREYISNQSDYFVNDYAANHELREFYENANINFVNIMNQCEVRHL